MVYSQADGYVMLHANAQLATSSEDAACIITRKATYSVMRTLRHTGNPIEQSFPSTLLTCPSSTIPFRIACIELVQKRCSQECDLHQQAQCDLQQHAPQATYIKGMHVNMRLACDIKRNAIYRNHACQDVTSIIKPERLTASWSHSTCRTHARVSVTMHGMSSIETTSS